MYGIISINHGGILFSGTNDECKRWLSWLTSAYPKDGAMWYIENLTSKEFVACEMSRGPFWCTLEFGHVAEHEDQVYGGKW